MMYCTGGIRCDIYSTYLRQKVSFKSYNCLGRGGREGYGGGQYLHAVHWQRPWEI